MPLRLVSEMTVNNCHIIHRAPLRLLWLMFISTLVFLTLHTTSLSIEHFECVDYLLH